jgi:hypothetical protein
MIVFDVFVVPVFVVPVLVVPVLVLPVEVVGFPKAKRERWLVVKVHILFTSVQVAIFV